MKQVHTSIRIEKDLHDKVSTLAESERRSFGNAINFILDQYFKMEEAKNGKSNK